jgi:HK97 family phage major capsid protein
MTELEQLMDQRNTLHKQWLALYDNRPPEMKPEDHVARLREINESLAPLTDKILAKEQEVTERADLEKQRAAFASQVQDYTRPVARPAFATGDDPVADAQKRRPASLGDAFIASPEYKAYARNTRQSGMTAGVEFDAGYGFKATFTTGTATVTGYDRVDGVVTLGQQQPHVADLLAKGQTTLPTIRYIQEDTYTNAATTVAEGAAKPEATFDTSEVDAAVRKIAVRARVTDEIFGDFPTIRSYINERLPFMVLQAEDTQLLTGDGNAPNLLGILNVSGIQTQAKSTDPTPDAVYKAMIKVMTVGFFMPDGVVFHPLDWQDIALLRTADGLYIWGNPAQAEPVQRIWGLPVVLTTSETQNTGLVGAFRLGAQVFYREGIRVEATNTNSDDFEKNLISIRAEQREALAVYRPKAFCTVTGI